MMYPRRQVDPLRCTLKMSASAKLFTGQTQSTPWDRNNLLQIESTNLPSISFNFFALLKIVLCALSFLLGEHISCFSRRSRILLHRQHLHLEIINHILGKTSRKKYDQKRFASKSLGQNKFPKLRSVNKCA